MLLITSPYPRQQWKIAQFAQDVRSRVISKSMTRKLITITKDMVISAHYDAQRDGQTER